ncbi:MAG TPA: alpha/beta hydrolase [Mycobacteriales bacterium]|nr:alpha/beta hydrolase [Mycobacteriales bacterium]
MPLVRVGRQLAATRLHYDRQGHGEPLLWITGFAISSEIFSPVLARYADGFDCISYDNRGAGRSPAPWRLTSMPQLAGDAVALLDALGIDSAHVYGLSMGGMIAQELALRFPDRVRALILGGTSAGGPRAVLPSPAVVTGLATGGGRGVSARAGVLGAALFTPAFRRREPELVREYVRLVGRHRSSVRGVTSHWWASVYHDTFARLPRIQAPTLVLHGAEDRLTPLANARLLAARIPDATLAVVPAAAHAYLLEQPEVSHRVFVDWLAARTPVRAGRALTGAAARSEPLTRALGLPVGALRTGRSLSGLPFAGPRAQRRSP